MPSDSEEEFDPKDLINIAKPPPSNFIWPPPSDEQKVPIAAPLYTAPPETQHFSIKPCTYRPLEKPKQQLLVQNVCKAESQQTTSTEYECLNVESNVTVTTSTSNASSESEYKMYQTQNNHYANMFEQTKEVDDEVDEINQSSIIDSPIELPKPIKRVEFVEPDPDYKAETFSSVFSNRKETWQKLTTSTISYHREERQEEMAEANDDNPNNSDEEQASNDERQQAQQEEQQEEDDEENDVEAEIKGQHAGPYDGTYYQLPPSNIPQPTPKKYMTDFHKALITTSERPYSIFDLAPTPEPKLPNLDFYEEAVREAEKYPIEEEKPKKVPKEVPKFEVKTNKHDIEFPYEDADVRRGSLIASMMRTASPKPVEFVKSNIIEQVQLPDEADAYFPPPISMQPHEPYGDNIPHRTKSPFVGAATLGADRPYTPFGREIMSQLSMDLPADTRRITFSNALHTAPDDSFNSSSLECEYEPIEYSAQVYERIAEEIEAEEEIKESRFAHVSSPVPRSYPEPFNATIQPWSSASDQIQENSYTDSTSGHESLECHVSESRRCSEFQRRRSSVAQENICENRQCSQGQCGGCESCRCKTQEKSSESRRQSQVQCESRRQSQAHCDSRRTSQAQCDNRRCSEAMKSISDLLKTKVREEEEFDPEKPNPSAPYPRRAQPSPFEGMQVKITNKMTSSLHKPDEIPTYQRKWFNLPTQNPPKTPEPEELRENIPIAFHDWPTSHNASRHSSIGAGDSQAPSWHRADHVRASIADTGMSLKPPMRQDFPVSLSVVSVFPVSTSSNVESQRSSVCREEAEDDFAADFKFPTTKIVQPEGIFPTRGVRKNSCAGLQQQQKAQLDRQRDLQHELKHQQQKMTQKQKSRQAKELKYLQTSSLNQRSEETIREEIQQNTKLSHYEMEQEYKRQLELERQQQQKEQEIKEQQAREVDYQRQAEEQRLREIKVREKRERDLQLQTQREMEYRTQREKQDEEQRLQQEQRDLELRKQQEEMETEIRRQQEKEKRMAEAREAQRIFEIRRREERDRELARLEEELRMKREEELKQLQREIREKREEQQREQREAEEKIRRDQKARDEAEREQRRLEEEAKKEKEDRERSVQRELKWRHKQEADRKQREEMELFNLEEEKRRQKTYESSTYQQQTVWPPSGPPTPAPTQIHRQVPIIKTDSETELNATKFRFEPLDEEQRRFMASIRPPSTCYSPATDDKPFPAIPYYQQHLVFVEAEANHQGIFDPKTISPTPNRSRSPAFGPPPNPLRAFVNKTRDPELDESGIYLCGERLLSPIWYDKKQKPIPPPVQRKIPLRGSPRPPSKPDLAALSEAVRKHKQQSATKPPPPPPPMPPTTSNQTTPKPVQRRGSGDDSADKTDEASRELSIPKGIVANQIRRLSGEISNSLSVFPIRSSITDNEKAREGLPVHDNGYRKALRQDDYYDARQETRQTMTMTNSFASSSAHQLTNNNVQSFNQHLMGQSFASVSLQNSQMNPNSVDNVRVSTGSVGQPGALPKHGRTFTTTGPNRGQGVLTQPSTGRVPICGGCASQVRLVMGSMSSCVA